MTSEPWAVAEIPALCRFALLLITRANPAATKFSVPPYMTWAKFAVNPFAPVNTAESVRMSPGVTAAPTTVTVIEEPVPSTKRFSVGEPVGFDGPAVAPLCQTGNAERVAGKAMPIAAPVTVTFIPMPANNVLPLICAARLLAIQASVSKAG